MRSGFSSGWGDRQAIEPIDLMVVGEELVFGFPIIKHHHLFVPDDTDCRFHELAFASPILIDHGTFFPNL
jgi:hypothetical protein